MNATLRRFRDDESIDAFTALLHRAYAPLAARGMRYVASWQTVEITARRLAGRECWVADVEGAIVGTVTLAPPGHDHGPEAPELYGRPDVATFGMFAVDPAHQGRGLGARLLGRIEERAGELGATTIALDTSEHATDLIAWYGRRGYVPVGRHDWRPHVNYESVILAKRLASVASAPPVPGGGSATIRRSLVNEEGPQ